MEDEPSFFLRSPALRQLGIPLAPATPAAAGGKGSGLLRLPPDWYPPSLIISPELHSRVQSGSYSLTDVQIGAVEPAITSALDSLVGSDPERMVLVRSSAELESIGERGKYESRPSSHDLTSVLEALTEIWQHASSNVHHGASPVGALVQPMLEVKISGHLSNEYRLSRDSSAWVFDQQHPRAETRQWRVPNSRPAPDGPLLCRTLDELEPLLRRVAKRLSDQPYRHHLEWVWDGSRLWIVQADRVPPLQGPAPGDAWQPTIGETLVVEDIARWELLSSDVVQRETEWTKVRAMAAFAVAGLPLAEVWKLAGAEVISQLASGEPDEELLADLDLICSGHVVVRTDIKGESEFMLDKSDALSDPIQVLAFLHATASRLIAEGADAGDICFLAHRFLRARGCAWTLARPGEPYVEVDSTWGLPDGLSWLPHDSSWVNVDSGATSRSTNGKTAFLDIPEMGGDWSYRDSPTEWIWRSSMTEDQLRTVARGSADLANTERRAVVTMWFIGMLDGADVECLPWFQAPYVPSQDRGRIAPSSKRFEIRKQDDLDALGNALDGRGTKVIRLLPGPELVRSKKFVDQVIAAATGKDVVVEIVGSPLAHPYYMLQKAGVAVSCVSAFDQPELRFNKLVRDRIPEQITAKGEQVVAYRAPDVERSQLLKQKVVEEALEVLRAETTSEILDELADLEEVVDALRVASKIKRDDIRRRRSDKRASRGGFQDALVLVSTGGEPQRDPVQPTLEGFEPYPLRVERPAQVQELPSRVVLSAIPPPSGADAVYEVAVASTAMVIEYRGSQIEIRPADPREPADFGQVALFDEGDSLA